MADKNTGTQETYQAPVPNADLTPLNRLVGTWELSGDATGTVVYEWLDEDNHFFLMQRFAITLYGHEVKGIEVIGHVQPFGEKPSKDIRSRAYDNTGNTLDYVYEIEADTLIIWGGEKGSPAYYKGTFSNDDTVNAGEWVYPDGGGYKSTMKRVK